MQQIVDGLLKYNTNVCTYLVLLICHHNVKRLLHNKHKFSQSKYSAEESTVGIEVSSPTNWLPLPSSSRDRKRGRKMGEDWTWHVQWVLVWHVTPVHTYTEGGRNWLMLYKENSMASDFESQYILQWRNNYCTMAICPNQNVGITQKPISLHIKEGSVQSIDVTPVLPQHASQHKLNHAHT